MRPGSARLRLGHVICPVANDRRSPTALAPGSDVADQFGAELVVLQAVQGVSGESAADLKQVAKEHSEVAATTWVDPDNPPAEAIVQAVAHRSGSIVCMTSHARGGLRRLVLGSVTEEVVRRADAPVLVLGPRYEYQPDVGLGGVHVLLDGSETAESVLPIAAGWALALDVGLRIVSVVAAENRRELDAGYHDRVRASLPPELDVGIVLLDGPPVDALAEHLDGADRALALAATHGRSGLERVSAGSVITGVLARTRRAMLVVRPEVVSTWDALWASD